MKKVNRIFLLYLADTLPAMPPDVLSYVCSYLRRLANET